MKNQLSEKVPSEYKFRLKTQTDFPFVASSCFYKTCSDEPTVQYDHHKMADKVSDKLLKKAKALVFVAY